MVCFPALEYIRGIYVVGKRKSNVPTLYSNVFLVSVFSLENVKYRAKC